MAVRNCWQLLANFIDSSCSVCRVFRRCCNLFCRAITISRTFSHRAFTINSCETIAALCSSPNLGQSSWPLKFDFFYKISKKQTFQDDSVLPNAFETILWNIPKPTVSGQWSEPRAPWALWSLKTGRIAPTCPSAPLAVQKRGHSPLQDLKVLLNTETHHNL